MQLGGISALYSLDHRLSVLHHRFSNLCRRSDSLVRRLATGKVDFRLLGGDDWLDRLCLISVRPVVDLDLRMSEMFFLSTPGSLLSSNSSPASHGRKSSRGNSMYQNGGSGSSMALAQLSLL